MVWKIVSLLQCFRYELFAVFGAVIVLWQMLLPGYVLTLDLVFGPHAFAPAYSGVSAASFPFYYLLYLLQFVASGWIVEKLLLATLFFFLFYLPLRFYPFSSERGEAYFAALVFAINPFVYERFLAGHLNVLFAYAFLFPFVSSLLRFRRELSWRSILTAAAWFIGIGVFSLHLFVMGVVMFVLFVLVASGEMIMRRERGSAELAPFVWRLGAVAMLVCAVSSYWIIPVFITGANTVDTFTQPHWEAFKTASGPYLGAIGNVTALYGFWGEHEMWSTYFSWPKDSWLWAVAGVLLAAVILLGIWRWLRERSARLVAVWFLSAGILSLIFSVGIGDSIFKALNLWLFEHVPLWQGFRDSQKWSAVLALAYALFGGLGAGAILERSAPRFSSALRAALLLALCALPLAYTPMLLGFSGQVRPVWYPESWARVNEVLAADPACVAVFLPWHLYYELSFNDGLLTANTAGKYFNCRIISSADAEIGGVGEATNLPRAYYEIAGAVANNAGDPDDTASFLAEKGVRYVIYTLDIADKDIYAYPFLHSGLLKEVVHTDGIALFEIRL